MSATNELDVESGYPHTLRPELHRALDAAGIDYWVAQGLTFWNCPDGRECVAYGYQINGMPKLAVKIAGITDPEQAITVTLGAGECHDIAETPRYTDKTRFECSACGYEYSAVGGFGCDYGDSPDFDYCPNCGRRCVR